MLAALALTAIAASSAQAAGNGLFLAGGNEVIAGTGISASTTDNGSLLSSGLNIECGSASVSGNLTSKTTGEGTATFHECIIIGGEEVCLVENEGLIETEKIKAETLLLGKIVRFSAAQGNVLSGVNILGHEEACTVIIAPELETINVEGTACAEVVEDTIKLLLTSPHCSLTVGGNAAEIHGQKVLVTSTAGAVTTHA
jgi:hypothetical protein